MHRREPEAVEGHQQIPRRRRQAAGDRHRAEEIAVLGVTCQVGTNSRPEVVQPATAPVAWLNKAASQLNAMLQNVVHFIVIVKQAVAVQPAHSLLRYLLCRWHKTVRADDLQIGLIPQDQVQVVIVIAVDVAPLPAAFTHGAKGDLPQAAQLAQYRGILLAVALPEVDGLAV